jgi:putative hydrolase of the HAD superfamily
MTIEAVLWDFGGVLTTSPFEAFNRFEAENGLPLDFIRQINATNPDDNAWAQFERSQISLDGFDEVFAAESKAAGHEVRGRQVIELLSGDIRPAVVAALTQCAQHFKIGCITNNVTAGQGPGMAHDTEKVRAIEGIMAQFDVVIESSKVGVRKPHPDIYLMACTALDVAPEACVYLDDLGINLKPARALGMTTIKVVDPELALLQLAEATGLTFSS